MGFSLELFFEELQLILAMPESDNTKVALLQNCIEKGKRYAQECGTISKDVPLSLFMPELLHVESFYVFDTETTGFAKNAEICQLGVVDNEFETAMDFLIKIKGEMPQAAYDIHHISVKECEEFGHDWSAIWKQFCAITQDKHLVAWNLGYDLRLLKQTCEIHNVDYDLFQPAGVHCAMKAYADHFEIERGREKLVTACEVMFVEYEDAHQAIGDCKLTLEVMKKVWELHK